MDFKKLLSQLDHLNEADVKHKGTYGTSYQGDDDEDDDKKTAPASTEKRGRGRPKKAGGDAANAAGYSGAKDLQSMMVGNIPKDSKELKKLPKTKHTLKDWIESIDEQMMLAEADQVTMEPAKQNTQVIKQGNKTLGTVSNPQLAAQIKQSIGKGEMSLAGDQLGEEGVAEAKNHMGETEYNTYAGWKAACRKAGADKFEGDRDICQAMKDGKGMGEWDGASGSVYDDSHKKKKMAEGIDQMVSSGHEIIANRKTPKGDFILLQNKNDGKYEIHKFVGPASTTGYEFVSVHNTPEEMQTAFKNLTGVAEGQSAKRDNRAEVAGKKVTKDLEYDMKHKGKDDNKAERAGKKVTKDIEYDEKKTPTMAHIKKMCKDGKTVAQICKMHPNCNQAELKKMIADCKKKMVAEGNLNEFYPSPEFGGDGDDDHDNYRGIYLHTAMLIDLSKFKKNPETAQYLIAHRVAKLVDPVDDEKVLRAYNEALIKQREIRRNRRKNSKQGISEGMDQRLEAARAEGRAHGLRGHAHCGNNYDDMEEARCYHDGYKAGLDECYGQMPIQGYVGEESDQGIMDTMDYDAELDEMDKTAYMKQQAIKTPGKTFNAFGQTMHDSDVLEDNPFFESLDKQLNALLNEDSVSEGMTVSISKGQENSPDSVSINASDAEADSLLAFVKQAGLGIFGGDDHGDMQDAVVTSAPSIASSDAIEVVDDHDGMLSLIRKMAGQGAAHNHSSEDYADEEETCNECGMAYESCGGNHGGEMVDEMESEDQMTYNVAEDNPPDTGAAETEQEVQDTAQANNSAASFDKAQAAPQAASDLATESEDDEEEEEGGYDAEGNQRPGGPYDAAGHYVGGYRGYDDRMKDRDLDEEEDELEESYANGADDTFESDIEFMTNIISNGLNKRKSTGQTTIPVVSTQLNRLGNPMKESTDLLTQWKKLSGI